MEFIWHDGGRAASGFVGTAGDCVTRSIAIATGLAYRSIYDELSQASMRSARNGVCDALIVSYLEKHAWTPQPLFVPVDELVPDQLPRGIVLVEFTPKKTARCHGHLSCVIDHTIYDTWNPFEDQSYEIQRYWTPSETSSTVAAREAASRGRATTHESRLTQEEYDKILRRVRALHRTASNHASTEGEIRNALRAMQSLMLEHNLSRQDIVDEDNLSRIGLTRRACPLNGRRCCHWESMLANYLTQQVFPTVQHYRDRNGHRTMFWFYGPVDDVQQILELFREMLLTIATAARLKYGSYARGSGASYAEGYVRGLPRQRDSSSADAVPASPARGELVHARALAVQAAAGQWLVAECGIRLSTISSGGRYDFDSHAHQAGQRDGAKHETITPRTQKRLTITPHPD